MLLKISIKNAFFERNFYTLYKYEEKVKTNYVEIAKIFEKFCNSL